MLKVEEIYDYLIEVSYTNPEGVSTDELAKLLKLSRSVVSRYLNELVKKERVHKLVGKPVKYLPIFSPETRVSKTKGRQSPVLPKLITQSNGKINLIGSELSSKPLVEKALAALFYPAKGLHILLSGETGVGKSHFAEFLAKSVSSFAKKEIPFVPFNCADYAQNPELLMGQIFGIRKGAFTGAIRDESGLVEKADGGILFLDEIHRLPPAGQEMLFYLIDKGIYRRLGEASTNRYAQITIIGATTESLESTVLPTLLRRFSVKLTIPPLRERSTEEREQLLHFFLEQEAKMMNVPLMIENECKQAFLEYACPGNIGQLKSDIQISCARSFMRYLKKEDNNVTIRREDLPSQVISSLTYHNEMFVPTGHLQENEVLPNIYQALMNVMEEAMEASTPKLDEILEKELEHYIATLKGISEKYKELEPSLVHFIDHDILEVLRESEFYFQKKFSFGISMKQLMTIGLHLQGFRKHAGDLKRNNIPILKKADDIYLEAAKQLGDFLFNRIHMVLPDTEISLIAYLLASSSNTAKTDNRVAVLVVTHGNSTASSMAEVANYLLGSKIIEAVDMPLTEPTATTYKQVQRRIAQMTNSAGVLMLVDIGSLVTMGDALQQELHIPIKTIANVNLPMLIEAGRKALIPENNLEIVYTETKSAYFALSPKKTTHIDVPRKQRLIITACFTGEGTAQLLQEWLKKNLPTKDTDVAFRALRIDPEKRDTSIIDQLKEQYHLIAFIGTVPINVEHIPFIPAWELLNNDGNVRLQRLLELTREEIDILSEYDERDVIESEIRELVEIGLGKIVHCLNPKLICDILAEHIPPLKHWFNWDTSRELGFWMHIGNAIDRLIQASLVNEVVADKELQHIHTKPINSEDIEMWEPLFEDLEKNFKVTLPTEMRHVLISLS